MSNQDAPPVNPSRVPHVLIDKTGHYALSNIHSVTPDTGEDPARTVAVLHHNSGHSFKTDTDYATVAAAVFEEDSN